MNKLIILATAPNCLGGALFSLVSLAEGFKRCNLLHRIVIPVPAGSFVHDYMESVGLKDCLHVIHCQDDVEFIKLSIEWVYHQPVDWPLWLDNCVQRRYLKTILYQAPRLRLSRRKLFFFFHDLGYGYNRVGFWGRWFLLNLLAPKLACNSHFTLNHIRKLRDDVQDVLYQPVDFLQFHPDTSKCQPPEDLQPILKQGKRVLFCAGRIGKASRKLNNSLINDKNMIMVPKVLHELKQKGEDFHAVVIGPDLSPEKYRTQELIDEANKLGVGDDFSVLSSTNDIAPYFRHVDLVVTFAPREPFGRTVVEALACGTPVVGSNTGGVGEILNHFAPQWTTDSADPQKAADTIINLFKAPETPVRLKEAESWVHQTCSVETYAKQVMAVAGIE